MRTLVVDSLGKAFNVLPLSTLQALVRCRVEGGYIIEINGERIFARSELSLPEGKIVNLKPISHSGGKIIFKVHALHEGQENMPSPQAPPNDVLPYLALSRLNLPITPERLKMLSRIVKMISEKSKEKSTPDPVLELGTKILNAAHLTLKDANVAFFALGHPVYGNILIKVKEEAPGREEEESATCISFAVDTVSLGKIRVDLFYSRGKLSGTLAFESPEKLNRAKSCYEEIKSQLPPSSLTESLQWRWKKSPAQDLIAEDLSSLKLSGNVDILL